MICFRTRITVKGILFFLSLETVVIWKLESEVSIIERFDQVLEEVRSVWEKGRQSPFIQEMRKGSLSDERFSRYLEQDDLYLTAYVRLCGRAIANAEDKKEIRIYLSLIDFSLATEIGTRENVLAGEFDDPTDRKIVGLPGTEDYIRFLMSFMDDSDNRRILPALLNCMLTYDHIFTRIAGDMDLAENKYSFFVRDYLTDRYAGYCRAWTDYAADCYRKMSSDEQDEFLQIMLAGANLENAFWAMAYGEDQ